MRECLLTCVENELHRKSATSKLKGKAILLLKAKAALARCCCDDYHYVDDYCFCPECGCGLE